MGSMSYHIMPLVINSLGIGHTHTDTHTDTYRHMHTHIHTQTHTYRRLYRNNFKNQAHTDRSYACKYYDLDVPSHKI